MTTRDRFLARAASFVGYRECSDESCPHPGEHGGNHTRFAAWAGHANGQPWCATFLVACAHLEGLAMPGASAYTPSLAAAFKNLGRWSTKPTAGAFVFFDFPGGHARIEHVEVVEAVTATGSLATIGGNTGIGDDTNGGQVMRRGRSTTYAVGYGLPAYDVVAPPAVPAAKPELVLSHLMEGLVAVFKDDTDAERAFIRSCYLRYLLREPESFEAVEWWRLELHSKGADAVIASFSDSAEGQGVRAKQRAAIGLSAAG